MRYRNRDPWKGAVAGLVGGAVGTLAMEGYWLALKGALGRDLRKAKSQQRGALDDVAVVPKQRRAGEQSTAAVGRIAYEAVAGGEPDTEEKEMLSHGVHWAYGIVQGGVYGALRGGKAAPPDPIGGAVFGTALSLFSEVGLPLLGLGKGPTATPPERHLAEYGAHVAYGLTVSAVTQLLRRAF